MSASPRPRIPRTVWVLGLVSLFTDMSSEFVHSLLPVFLAGTLGASALAIGLIEGAAEAIALATKVFSGYLSDVFGRRKPLVLLGYALAALTKPLFPLAGSVGWVVTARFVDRVGKGIRGAPRDAMVADATPPEIRGAAYGLRQALDSVGAIAGPLLAIAALLYFANDLRAALWVAVVPGLLSVALLLFALREPERDRPRVAPRLPLSREGLRQLGRPYWMVVALGAWLALARSSEAFLVLRGSQLGLSLTWVPLVIVVMALVYTVVAYPAGRWADRGARRALLCTGMLALAAADLVLAWAPGIAALLGGVALWGLHMGLTQGVVSVLIAELAPAELRGTAFGMFNLVAGMAILVGAGWSGWLWDAYGPAVSFLWGSGAALAGAAAVLLLPAGRPGSRTPV